MGGVCTIRLFLATYAYERGCLYHESKKTVNESKDCWWRIDLPKEGVVIKMSHLANGLLGVALALAMPALAQEASKVSPLSIEKQGSFFVGGRGIHSDT